MAVGKNDRYMELQLHIPLTVDSVASYLNKYFIAVSPPVKL